MRWTCPACEREFERARQGHVCVPGGTVEEAFAGRPPGQREIYAALRDALTGAGPVHEDAVSVGVFLKHERKFAEVRPAARALNLWLVLARRLDSPRVARYFTGTGRIWHVFKLTAVEQVDAELRAWLVEAYDAAGSG